MAPSQYTRYVLNERPGRGPVNPRTFRKEVVPFDLKPGKGEILVQVLYLSLDPANRTWLNDARNYMEPVKIGETMRAGALGRVIQVGEGTKFVPGDLVNGTMGMYFGLGLWSGGGWVLNWFVRVDGVYCCAFERLPEDCVSAVLCTYEYADF